MILVCILRFNKEPFGSVIVRKCINSKQLSLQCLWKMLDWLSGVSFVRFFFHSSCTCTYLHKMYYRQKIYSPFLWYNNLFVAHILKNVSAFSIKGINTKSLDSYHLSSILIDNKIIVIYDKRFSLWKCAVVYWKIADPICCFNQNNSEIMNVFCRFIKNARTTTLLLFRKAAFCCNYSRQNFWNNNDNNTFVMVYYKTTQII